MKALNKCKWIFEVEEFNLSEEKNFRWAASTRTMDKNYNYQFANGGIGSLNCVRLFNNLKDIKIHINKFISINKIIDFQIKVKEDK